MNINLRDNLIVTFKKPTQVLFVLIAGIDTYRRSVIYELEGLLATQREKSSGHLKKFCRNYCGVFKKKGGKALKFFNH